MTSSTLRPPNRRSWLRDRLDDAGRRSPGKLALAAFAVLVVVFTALLSLPVATASGRRPPFLDALFTATSAVTLTGQVTVDTASYWSVLGQATILVGVQLGGLAVLTLATVVGLAVSRRLGLAGKLIASDPRRFRRLGEVGSLIRIVVLTELAIELVVAVVLLPRFLTLGDGVAAALWHAVFYGVSSVNNAGFIIDPSLTQWVGDWWFSLPVALGVFAGSLGFPVVLALSRLWRTPSAWSVNTKITTATSTAVLGLAVVSFALFEWSNPATLGPLPVPSKMIASIFAGVMPRSGGFSTVPVAGMHETTWLTTDLFMFIGGGSASTAGGVKVGTLAVLLLAGLAEARGDRDIEIFRRRIPTETVRLAVTVLLTWLVVIGTGTLLMLAVTGGRLDQALFSVTAAFGTCGLTPLPPAELPVAGQYLLIALMFAGRTGPLALSAALALRRRQKLYRLPEERPIVG